MNENKRLKIACLGCGNRARVYLDLMAEQPENFDIVAAADIIPSRVDTIKKLSNNPNFLSFKNAKDLLDAPKVADVLVIATQDSHHFEPCIKALQKGYDIVLEKPMSDNVKNIIKMEEEAAKLGRRVIVCHVLRYTSFYRKLKEIIQNGELGDVITMNASEGVEPWHFAHSYVRGHWSIMENSTPTIVAKCSHDMDILHWMLEKKCKRISSFGHLSFFKDKNAKHKNEYPMFDAQRYLEPQKKVWLDQVFDNIHGTNKEISEWLKTSKWGRSVFSCDNTAIDHQVINFEFDDSVTATFTMTAFNEGRDYEINGTKARLRAGDFYKKHCDADIIITEHASGNVTKINVMDQNPHIKYGGYHAGGDVGYVKELFQLLTSPDPPLTSISNSVHSHIMAFASEEARLSGEVINVEKYYQSHKPTENALD